jgi:hypothetical protein
MEYVASIEALAACRTAPSKELEVFAAIPSNQAAIAALTAFSQGRRSLVALRGAAGWGTSHLLRAVAELAEAHCPQAVQSMTAEHWLRSRSAMDRVAPGYLILDDVETALSKPRSRQLITMELERRIRAKRPTLCAIGMDSKTLKVLPYFRLWHTVSIDPPSVEERKAVIASMCRREGLAVPEAVQSLVAKLVNGDGRSLLGAIARLRAAAGELDVAKAHPMRVVGLLHPYLIDNSDFDLRDLVLESVTKTATRGAEKLAGIAVYAMTDVAGLCEQSVATYFGMKQGDVYRLRRQIASRISGSGSVKEHLDRALAYVTDQMMTA